MTTLDNTYKQTDLKWHSKSVNNYKGNLLEIISCLPVFKKQPFKLDGSENKHLDTIVNISDGDIPVTTVSKSYSLVQHFEILEIIAKAFQDLKYNIDETKCNLHLTEYGECMWLKIDFWEEGKFDPGDGHILIPQLHVRNSVDKSVQLAFELSWYRLICKNGLISLDTEGRFNKRHTKSLKPELLTEYLARNISKIEQEKEVYRRWKKKELHTDTNIEILRDWIHTTVFDSWDLNYAERVYSIIETGQDIKVTKLKGRTTEENKDSDIIKITLEGKVPGTQPAENIYDVANALSWVASHQNSLQNQYKMMIQVPKMLEELEKSLR